LQDGTGEQLFKKHFERLLFLGCETSLENPDNPPGIPETSLGYAAIIRAK
jgi:hypothetical protein